MTIIQKKHYKIILAGAAVFVFKLVILIYLAHLAQCAAPTRALGKLAFSSGDTHSYTGAMENYIQENSYFFFNGHEKVFAGRSPHYSIPYWLFRQFTSPASALDLVVIFQLIFESIAIVALFLLTKKLIDPIAGWMMFLLLLASTNWTDFSYYASPESLSISFLSLFLYFQFCYIQEKKSKHLLLCSVFLGLLVTLKAYFAFLYLVVGVQLIFETRSQLHLKDKLRPLIFQGLIMSIPLIALLLPWVIRNYNFYHKFIPFQINAYAGYHYTEADFAFRRFVTSYGGDIVFWEKTSAGCYFMPNPGIQCEYQFPDYLFSKEITREKIERLRHSYIEVQRNGSQASEKIIAERFDSLTLAFRNQHPGRYYFLSRVELVRRFLGNSGSYYLPIHNSNPCYAPQQLAIKITQSMLYWLSLFVGLPFLCVLSWKRKFLSPAILPISIIMIFPIVLKATEWRYFRTVEPVLYIGLCYGFSLVFNAVKNRLGKRKVRL
jgi:hypothetical protein